MRKLATTLFALVLFASTASGQWIKQTVNTTASFRGLSVVNEKVVWASGTGGTVIRTIDAGKTWTVMAVPGAEKLDFRDIEAFDANTAYILSIGNGESSRIYKTTNGGKTWKLQFKGNDLKLFFDAIACWDRKNCLAMSDPVDGKFFLIETKNGDTWSIMDNTNMQPAKEGEAAFAASGTCLITQGKNNAFLVSGGNASRVFRSNDRGKTWQVSETPITKGTPGSGIFSIAMRDSKNGVIIGGDYENDKRDANNFAFTSDGGLSWTVSPGPNGYRSGVVFLDKESVVAVGSSGSDIRWHSNSEWLVISEDSLNAVQSDKKYTVWAVGPQGTVVKKFFGTDTNVKSE
jgi:photosystem II stability/assembly factor-like uncharacterized protein